VAAQPHAVAVGEPITLTMTISGKGNFDRVSVPEFPTDENWKSYSANGTFFSSGDSYTGKKVFERAVVAKNSALTAIPSLRFSYFDPAKESYVTLDTEPLSLQVEEDESAGENTAIPPAKPRDPEGVKEKQATALRMQISLTSGDFHEEITPLYERIWFWFTLFICSALLLALTVYHLARRHRLSTLEQRQKRRLQHTIQTGLVTLHETAAAGDNEAFFKGCLHLIRLRLASDWNIEPAAISLYDLEQRLSGDSALVKIFNTAQQHAYGGLHLDTLKMNALLAQLRRALEEES
ncbi:MAG TPA: BatD family protein, partial [Desulfopila sp.]|nr:BatD family protein [Desulfopila sp.]